MFKVTITAHWTLTCVKTICPPVFDMDNPLWEDEFFADLEETPEQGANDGSDVEDDDIDDLYPTPLKLQRSIGCS